MGRRALAADQRQKCQKGEVTISLACMHLGSWLRAVSLSASLWAAGSGCRARLPEPAPPLNTAPAPTVGSNDTAQKPSVTIDPGENEPTAAPMGPQGTPVPAPVPRVLRRCFDSVALWVAGAVPDLLDRAENLLQSDDAEGALACAEEASRQAPRSIDAHQDRASALLRLGRLESAREAITLALALAPQDASSLVLAADFFINQLPPTSERARIGLEYVRRAVTGGVTKSMRSRLWLLEGQALIDLGLAQMALLPLQRAFAQAAPELKTDAAYEIGVAQFELSRFDDARKQLDFVLAKNPNHPPAHFHMGLVLERAGEMALAAEHFNAASAGDANAFPPTVNVDADAFAEQVRQAVSDLPSTVQENLHDMPVQTAELPALEDLTAEAPPLSPTILGLFRGLPLGHDEEETPKARLKNGRPAPGRNEAAGTSSPLPAARYLVPQRAIFIYRRNLLRSVRSQAEVQAAIARTLLHEVGHLLGEDDGSLRDRGLQ